MRIGLDLHLTGACRHPEYSTRRDAPLRPCSFPMYAAVLNRGGDLAVFDPGYAPRFNTATEPFPERFYRWLTPVRIPPDAALAHRLAQSGRHAAARTVILSHFHADHIAGLADFPDAHIVCSRRAYEHFRALSGFGAVRAGYLKALLPADFETRVTYAEDLPARPLPRVFWPFTEGRDAFGDGSVLLVPLPGHSVGQIGAAFIGADGQARLLIADAAWSVPALHADAPPPWLTMWLIGSPGDFRATWSRLRQLITHNPDTRLIACHCATSAAGEGCPHV
jgi:glyoxylase-like metal-dependent hydrolase (beta-lactamase superfamily II)